MLLEAIKGFKSRGQDSTDSRWVDDIKKARIYPKPGPVKGIATWYRKNAKEIGKSVEVLELNVTSYTVIT